MYLGIVPARAGSKGIPRKNVLELAGKPTIQWTFDAIKGCSLLDRVVCSTNCEIARSIAEANAIEVHNREEKDAEDESPIIDVLTVLANKYSSFSHIVLLQVTCPCRSSESIDKCIKVAMESGCDTVITGYKNEHLHPSLLFQRRKEDGCPEWLLEGEISSRRQDQSEFFTRAGVCYVIKRQTLLNERSIYGKEIRSVILKPNECINLDEPRDLIMAEHYLRIRHGRS